MVKEKIRTLIMYEILGRPPEYIKESLNKFIDSLNNKPGIKLISKKIHEPKPLEKENNPEENSANEKELFTTFGEVELEIEDINILLSIVLNTLPANVEVLEPSGLTLTNFDISALLNELTIKLHKYDEVAKVLTMERNNLLKKSNI